MDSTWKEHKGKPDQPSAAELPEGVTVKAATVDKAGERFGRLVAIRVVGKKNKSLKWLCVCDCGTVVERSAASLHHRPGVRSCGCYLKEHQRLHLMHRDPWNRNKSYANKGDNEEYANRGAWTKAVQRRWGVVCERCGWDEGRCDSHHLKPRSRGGKNTVLNAVVICPCCHRLAHEVGQHVLYKVKRLAHFNPANGGKGFY